MTQPLFMRAQLRVTSTVLD